MCYNNAMMPAPFVPPPPHLPPPRLSRRRLIGRGVLAGVAAFVPLRLFYATRNPIVSLPTPVLPSPNAYDVFVRASEQLVQKETVLKAAPPAALPPKNAPVVTLAQKQALLRANKTALRIFREGLSLPYHAPPERQGDAFIAHFSAFRTLAKLLVIQADVLFEQGDATGGVQSCLDAVYLGQVMPRGGSLITRLVGIACQAIGRNLLWKRLHDLDGAAAKAGAHRMESIGAAYVPMAETWAEEKYFVQTALGEQFRDPQKMASVFDDPQGPIVDSDTPKKRGFFAIAGVYAMYFLWSKPRIMDNMTRFMDALGSESQKPYARAQTPVPRFDPVTAQMPSLFDQARLKDAESSQTQNALLCAALALQAYRAERGGFPDALSDLVTHGYLSAVPRDPFSLDGNTPLLYRKQGDAPLLWSVGPDGKNDNGVPIEDKTKTGNAQYFVSKESRGDVVAETNRF